MSRKFDYLGDVEVFIAVVEHGSFTGAAVALSTTPSVLSRAVTRLEARLGRQLLQRTTRRVGLTEAGRVYLEQARSAFSLLDDAERVGRGQEGDLTGRVRMSVPTTYAHYRLPPLLAHYNQRYPRVQVELNITNRNVDLIAEGFDLAIRLGQLPDSGLVARKLEDAALLLVASRTTCIGEESLRRWKSCSAISACRLSCRAPGVSPHGYFMTKGAILTGCRGQLSKYQTMFSAWFRWRSRGWGSAKAMNLSFATEYRAAS